MSWLASFEEKIFSPETGIYDQEGVHHEFSQGLHGRKADFGADAIKEGTPLYEEWVEIQASYLKSLYTPDTLGRAVLVGLADGTNPVVRDLGSLMNMGHIKTEKISPGPLGLSEVEIELLQALDPELAIEVEDVGTRGTNSASAAVAIHANRNENLKEIEVAHTLMRGIPSWLVNMQIVYYGMIDKKMRDYTAEECAKSGYCAQGWELVPYGR